MNGNPLDPVDVAIGKRLRLRRQLLGMSCARLAAAVGISSSQIEKYERGYASVRMNRLQELAAALDVPFGYFFQSQAEIEPRNSE